MKNKKLETKTVHIMTLFPESVAGYLSSSMLKRAQTAGMLAVRTINPRDFANDKHQTADDRPYGGGPGMVLKAPPFLKAVESAFRGKGTIVLTTPSGKQFTNADAKKLSKAESIIFIAGHYEGIDARVKKALKKEYGASAIKEFSVGPYILTGGELPALVMLDAIARQIPGVLGKGESLEETRTASPETYTRPEVLEWKGKKYRVPKVLTKGNHKEIEKWRTKRVVRGK